MELQLVNKEKDLIEVKVLGETHTICNLLRDELWNVSDISFASYNLRHPLVGSPVIVVKTKKGDPKKALFEAIDSIKKKSKELKILAKKLS